jgi:hypothetical protein
VLAFFAQIKGFMYAMELCSDKKWTCSNRVLSDALIDNTLGNSASDTPEMWTSSLFIALHILPTWLPTNTSLTLAHNYPLIPPDTENHDAQARVLDGSSKLDMSCQPAGVMPPTMVLIQTHKKYTSCNHHVQVVRSSDSGLHSTACWQTLLSRLFCKYSCLFYKFNIQIYIVLNKQHIYIYI